MSAKQQPDDLTPREALFVLKMVELQNGTEAYLAAGYKCTRNAARAHAARLVAKGSVAAALERARSKVLERAEIDAAEAFRRIARIADFEIGQLLDDKGAVLPLHKLPLEVRRCIKRVDKDGQVYVHDVMRALELIAESGGLIRRKVDATFEAGNSITELFKAVTEKRAAKLQGAKK